MEIRSANIAIAARRALNRAFVYTLAVTFTLYTWPVPLAYANPAGGTVSGGAATITTSGATETITQSTGRAVIDWSSFNIGGNETTRFIQPSSSSLTVNRVNDINPSQILGTLTANGNIVLINPNGVFFAPGSTVNVNGLIATTSTIGTADAMSGNLRFTPGGNPGASVVNQGTITAAQAGLVGLVAPNVENSGVITATLGRVQLASGDSFTLDLYGDRLMELGVSDAVSSQLVQNTGVINAAGGTVQLTAAAGRQIVNSLIEVEGEIHAPAFAANNGEIDIYAEGSNAVEGNVSADKGQKSGASEVLVSGTLDASGKNAGKTGGSISVLGDHVGILSGSVIDASGDAGGGTIKIGGDFHGQGTTPTAEATVVQSGALIDADALTQGNGGNVAVWSDNYTNFAGTIEAKGGSNGGNGGFAETSGKQVLDMTGNVDASASKGTAGTWLMDPYNVTIGTTDDGTVTSDNGSPTATFTPNATGNVSHTTLETALNGGTNVVVTTGSTGSAGADNGDITVSSAISATTGTSNLTGNLTLSAYRNIILNGAITLGGGAVTGGALTLRADNGGNGSGYINIEATIATYGGNIVMGGGSGTIAGAILNADGTVNTAATGFATGNVGQPSGIYNAGFAVQAGGGNIIANGTGYAGTSHNYGVDFGGSSLVLNTSGSGIINVTGIGGNGSSFGNYGVFIDGSSIISSVNGDITVIGSGGTGAATTSNYGLESDATSGIKTTGAGNIWIVGTGGGSGANINNYGVNLTDSNGIKTTSSGNITITGVRGNGDTATNYGAVIGHANDLRTTGSGNITVNTDTINLSQASDINSINNLTIAQYTNNGTIGIGAGTGTLGLTDTYLGYLTVASGKTLTIGKANSGNIDVNDSTRTFANPLYIVSGGNITLDSVVNDSYSGTALVIAATGNFVNNVGNNPLNLTGTSPNWDIYSFKAANDTNGAGTTGLSPDYTTNAQTYVSDPPGVLAHPTNNNWIYGYNPVTNLGTITITASGQTVTYGTAPTTGVSSLFSCSGSGSACSDISGDPSLSIILFPTAGGVTTSTSSNYSYGTWSSDIAAALGSLTFNSGYTGTFSYTAGTLTVNAKPLTVASGVTVNNKAYDGATNATLAYSSPSLTGVVGIDSVSVNQSSSYTANFGSANVASGIGVTVSNLGLTGADATDYTLTQPSLSANITARPITLTASDQTQTYGFGGNSAALGTSGFTLTSGSMAGSELVTAATLTTNASKSTSGNYNSDSYNSGNPWTIAITSGSETGSGGFALGNYAITLANAPTGLTVNAKNLTYSGLSANNKTYDGTTTVLGFTGSAGLTGGGTASGDDKYITSDLVAVTGTPAGTFASANAGSRNVTVTGLSLDSEADAANYTLTGPAATLSATILQKALTVTANGQTQTYGDGNILTQGVTAGATGVGSQAVTGATLSVDAGTPITNSTSGNWSAGTYTIDASAATGSGGFLASNYNITYNTGTLLINPKNLTYSGLSANDKTYDGTTTVLGFSGSAALTGGGTASGDDKYLTNDLVAVTGTPAGTFASANAGSRNVTVTGLSLDSEADAANYTLTGPASTLSATITARPITLTASDQTQTYGFGGNSAALGTSGFTLTSGSMAGSELVTAATLTTNASKSTSGNYNSDSYNSGNPWTIAITSGSETGSGGFALGNYAITLANAPTGLTVNAKNLTYSGLSANNKTYDGTTTVLGFTGSAGLTGGGTASGDDKYLTNDLVAVTGTPAGTFASANAGSRNVTVTGLSLDSEADAANYTLTGPAATLSATILQKALTVTANGQTQTYGDGNILTQGVTAGATGVGSQAVTGATLSVDAGTPITNSTSGNWSAGTYTIDASAATGSGGFLASNYNITYNTGTLLINPKNLTYSGLSANDKTYDGTTTVLGFSGSAALTGGGTASGDDKYLTNDLVAVTGTPAGTFASANAGSRNVTVTGLSLDSEADAANYTLTGPASTLSATITARPITLTASDQTQTYGFGGNSAALGTSGFTLTSGSMAGSELVTAATLTTNASKSTSGNYNSDSYNSGNPWTIAITSGSETGSGGFALGNYAITLANAPTGLTVNAKNLTYSGLSANDKTYDGTTTVLGFTGSAALTGGGTASGDDKYLTNDLVAVTGTPAGTFASANAGSRNVTVTGLSLDSEADAANYTLTGPAATLSATILQKALTVTANGQTQTYGDGNILTQGVTAGATGVGSQAVTGATLSVDAGTPITNSTSGNWSAGTYTIDASAATGSGGFLASNYNITYNTGTLLINPKNLTYSGLSANDKTYDGTTTVLGFSGSAALTGGGTASGDDKYLTNDLVAVTGTPAGTFASANAGSRNVTVTGLSLDSEADAANYTLTGPASTLSATITARPITLTASDQTQTYGFGGNSAALGTSGFTLTSGSMAGSELVTAATLTTNASKSTSGNYNSDSYNSGNPWTIAITSGSETGSGGFALGNYAITLANAPTGLTVNAKNLTYSGLSANNKTYDGTTTVLGFTGSAALTGGGSASGDNEYITNDLVGVTGTPAGTFASANAGSRNVTVTGLSLDSEADAANYTLTGPAATLSATITAAGSGNPSPAQSPVLPATVVSLEQDPPVIYFGSSSVQNGLIAPDDKARAGRVKASAAVQLPDGIYISPEVLEQIMPYYDSPAPTASQPDTFN